jgi:D-aminoacyl-tRNA deacylase
MRALLQRVDYANVVVAGTEIGAINQGVLVFLGVAKPDDENCAKKMAEKVVGYRVFSDAEGRMNLSVQDVSGGILIVPQFTLVADTSSGRRAGFSSSAGYEQGERLFDYFVEQVKILHSNVATGMFRADMRVTSCNNGPVTFILDVNKDGQK